MSDATLLPLEKLDPADAWKPWQPDAKHPWDLKWAGHLYRRAAFGAGLRELREAVKRGFPATLDLLMEGEPGAKNRLAFLTGKGLGGKIAEQSDQRALRGWWLYSMLHSMHPLREKMTLFWHDHFATSITKVQKTTLMYQQNLTLRQHALGKFPAFLLAMSKDPAMLLWLDSNSNVKGKANENYAREVMELFSLGVNSVYTEKDIREAARAFTGWHTDEGKFVFKPNLHDDGTKTVLKKTGKWNGNDVLDICLGEDVAARFLVRKLYRFLVNESQVPPDSFIEPLAESFRKSGYDIKALVRQMIASRHFFSAHAYRQRIKSPVEYVVGTVWALSDRNVPQGALVTQLEAMGQALFAPPNVKGWPGSTAWLNTSTVIARHNFAQQVTTGGLRDTNRYSLSARDRAIQEAQERALEQQRRLEEARRAAEEARLKALGKPIPPRPPVPPPPPPPANMDVAELARNQKATTPEAIVGLLVDLLLQGTISNAARGKLIAFVKESGAKDNLDRRVRETAHMVMTLPEYQLC